MKKDYLRNEFERFTEIANCNSDNVDEYVLTVSNFLINMPGDQLFTYMSGSPKDEEMKKKATAIWYTNSMLLLHGLSAFANEIVGTGAKLQLTFIPDYPDGEEWSVKVWNSAYKRSKVAITGKGKTLYSALCNSRLNVDYKKYIQSDEWKEKASAAKEAAGWRCQLCNKEGDKSSLHAHHRTYDRLGCEHPEDITVLCADCHAKHHDE